MSCCRYSRVLLAHIGGYSGKTPSKKTTGLWSCAKLGDYGHPLQLRLVVAVTTTLIGLSHYSVLGERVANVLEKVQHARHTLNTLWVSSVDGISTHSYGVERSHTLKGSIFLNMLKIFSVCRTYVSYAMQTFLIRNAHVLIRYINVSRTHIYVRNTLSTNYTIVRRSRCVFITCMERVCGVLDWDHKFGQTFKFGQLGKSSIARIFHFLWSWLFRLSLMSS